MADIVSKDELSVVSYIQPFARLWKHYRDLWPSDGDYPARHYSRSVGVDVQEYNNKLGVAIVGTPTPTADID